MCTFREMLARFESFNAIDATSEVMGENSDPLTEIVRRQQLSGEDAENKPFYQYRNKEYAEYKHEQNPAPGYGIADFKLTGDFQNAMYLKVTGQDFEFDSSDPKADRLKGLAKGAPFLKLSEENKKLAWVEIIRNPFVNKLAETLQVSVV